MCGTSRDPSGSNLVKWLLRALAALVGVVSLFVVAVVTYLAVLYWNGSRGESFVDGEPVVQARSPQVVEAEAARQRTARATVERADAQQILFGDLHAHTHYSADAHLQAVGLRFREGASPPADACDFARFCSQRDFWSINDHAESLTPAHWRETVEAVQQCNAVAGDPVSPDLVTFLGWEWTHQKFQDAATHYGHKNVVLREYEPGRVPERPITSVSGAPWPFLAMGAVAPLFGDADLATWADFDRYARDLVDMPDCEEGVPVRDLPKDCRESASDPAALFAKLRDWDLPAIVIPHGLSWGTTNPVNARLDNQLAVHDPAMQPLLEVYSGHGNSEVYREFTRPRFGPDGKVGCPTDGEDIEWCCERAASIVRARCEDPQSETCASQVAEAVDAVARVEAIWGNPTVEVPDTTPADWGDCGQLRASFLPAFDYRPRQSAQYGLALGGKESGARFRFGFIGSSDTHRSRPGTGYREFARELMTDGADYPIPSGLQDDRDKSFYYTGGLAAVHAAGRDREAIFDALSERHVYGTSGERMLLWFDHLAPDGTRAAMGSEVVSSVSPRFEVRALGAFVQKPGCPDFAVDALTPERVASLCRGECYHPGDTRVPIERIEVVRIRPQRSSHEPIRPLIEDPWRSFACPADGSGCVVHFEDDAFVRDARESVYYVRAIQTPTPAVNGDPLRCERDDEGVCIASRPCDLGPDGLPDDCLAEVGERAWSSPIFVEPS